LWLLFVVALTALPLELVDNPTNLEMGEQREPGLMNFAHG